MSTFLSRLFRNQSGAVAIEYALIAALIGAALVGAWAGFGDVFTEFFGDVGTMLSNQLPAAGT